MKLKYVVFAVALALVFGILAFAGTGGLKNDFFTVDSLLNADDLKLFDGTFTHDKITKYDFEIKNGAHEISYSLYTENFKTFFLESKDSFDFAVKCDKSVAELNIPWSLVEYFHNSKKYNREYSSLYDGIIGVLKKNTDDSDFSSSVSVVNYNGLKRQSNAITLELKDMSDVTDGLKSYLSSSEIADLLNELYGADCTDEQLSDIIDGIMCFEVDSLLYKRSIISGIAYEETVALDVGDSVFNVKIRNNASDIGQNGTITVTDAKNTVDFSLELTKNDDGESLVIRNAGSYTEISAKDKKSMTYFSKNGDYEMKMTASTIPDISFGDNVYDATASSGKNLMLCELSPWLRSNGNAAILFRTYEVDLKPLKITPEDLKINFDE